MHPLCDKSNPYVFVTFIHFRDNKEHVFYSCVNEMTGNRLTAFDNDPPEIDSEMDYIKSVLKGLKKKSNGIVSVEVHGKQFEEIFS